MKKIYLLILLSIGLINSQAQIYQKSPLYGTQASRGAFDSTLFIPTGCGEPSGTASLKSINLKMAAKYFDSCAGKEYIYNPKNQSWKVSGATSLPWDSITVKPSNFSTTYALSNDVRDSILARLSYRDTSAMFSNYRRSTTKITNSDLANSTISGVSLGSNLAYLMNGYGISGMGYNGAGTQTFRIDTSEISTKANVTGLLVGYASTGSVAAKLNIFDTTAMLANRLKISDTANMLSTYARTSNIPNFSDKVNVSDTATMLSNYRRKTTLIENADLRNSAITINGSSTSLGGSISVGTVTSVAASAGTGISVSGSPITSSGTLTITNTAPDQTVTLTAGSGISVTGTYPNFTVTNSSPSSGGTVTSVSAGIGMSFTTITSTGAVNADTTVLATRAYAAGLDVAKANTSLNNVNGVLSSTYGGAGSVSGLLKANGSGVVSAAVAGTDYALPSIVSGTSGNLSKFTSSTTIGNSIISESGSTITVSGVFRVNGAGFNATPTSTGTAQTYSQFFNTGNSFYVGNEGSSAGGFFTGSSAYAAVLYSNTPIETIVSGTKQLAVSSGTITALVPISGTSLSMSGGGQFNGNVGIGGAALERFTVTGATGTTGYARFTDNTTSSLFIGNSSGVSYLHSNSNELSLGASVSNVFSPTLTVKNGDVLINTTTTDGTNKLIVNGGVKGTKGNFTGGTGETMLVTGATGEWSQRITASSSTNNSFGLIVNGGTSTSDIAFKVTSQSGGTDYLVTRGDGLTTARKMVVSGGSGELLTVNGVTGENAARITGSSSTSNSFGLLIAAGTNASDVALNVTNQDLSTTLFRVRGDGAITASSSVTAGGFVSSGGRTTTFGYRLPDWQIYNTTGGALSFNNYTSDFLTITSVGNVGINNLGANAKLEVAASSGEVFRADAASGAFRIIADQTGVRMNGGGTTTSTLELGSSDNATVSSPYSLVFQSNNTGAISGRDIVFKNGGKGYSDGTTLLTIYSTGDASFSGQASAVGLVSTGNVTVNNTVASLNLNNTTTGVQWTTSSNASGFYSINNGAGSGIIIGSSSNITAGSFIKSGGASSQALIADGSVQTVSASPTANAIVAYNSAGQINTNALIVTGGTSTKALMGDGSQTNLIGDTYTPTITNLSNVTSSTARVTSYTRVGNIVTVSGFVSITPTSNETETILGISLPIASNFTSTDQASGSGNMYISSSGGQVGKIESDASNDRVTLYIYPYFGASSAIETQFTFTYRVI